MFVAQVTIIWTTENAGLIHALASTAQRTATVVAKESAVNSINVILITAQNAIKILIVLQLPNIVVNSEATWT